MLIALWQKYTLDGHKVILLIFCYCIVIKMYFNTFRTMNIEPYKMSHSLLTYFQFHVCFLQNFKLLFHRCNHDNDFALMCTGHCFTFSRISVFQKRKWTLNCYRCLMQFISHVLDAPCLIIIIADVIYAKVFNTNTYYFVNS